MDRTFFLAVFGLCLLLGGVVSFTPADQVSGTTEATSKFNGCPQVSTALQIPFGACHVQESKVTKVMAQISSALQLLNLQPHNGESAQLEALPKLEEHRRCLDSKIQHVTNEVVWVTRQIWRLLSRLQKPADAQLQSLKQRKNDLVRHLRDLVVYTGGSPASGMQLVTFKTQVDLLDAGFNEAFAAFDTLRPVRNNVESVLAAIKYQSDPSTKGKKIRSTILDPRRIIFELVELSETYPDAMSEALPHLISSRYDGKLDNIQLVLDLIKQLPNVVHQMIGYDSLYDEMSANSDLETYELTELVLQLKGLNTSVTSAAEGIPASVLMKFTQLLDTVWPVYQVVGREWCEFRNLKYGRTMTQTNLFNVLQTEDVRGFWHMNAVLGTGKFTTGQDGLDGHGQMYSSGHDVYSASRRSVKFRFHDQPGIATQWKFVPVNGGKYFKVLNAMYDEVMFAAAIPSSSNRRLFLARHDYSGAHDIAPNADLWIISCRD